jgi:anti-sigma-K factor RsiG
MPRYTGRRRKVPSDWSKTPTLNLCLSVYSALTRDAGGTEMAEEDLSYDSFPDLGALSDEELKGLIQRHTEEEQEVSYKRRILHGKIDILRAELVNRLRKKHQDGESVITGADVQQLTDILAGKSVPDADVN